MIRTTGSSVLLRLNICGKNRYLFVAAIRLKARNEAK
jgi:hypothetical protein